MIEDEEKALRLEIKKLKRENDRLRTERDGMASMYEQSTKIQEHIQKKLVVAMEEAQAADIAKGNFLANMSHEIRTPMNAIVGFSEFIIRDSDDKVAIENAVMINNAANSLVTIINDILDYSKVLSGKMELVEDDCELGTIIDDVSTMISMKLIEKKVNFIVDVDYSLPNNLYADEIRIKQVLINILNNACKFTEEGGISLKVTGSYANDFLANICFTITDTGIGIKEENLSKIFNQFEQVDTKKNRTVEGTGLGLAISRQLIELMHGNIAIQSKYGQGTSISFEIPVKITDKTPVGHVNYIKSEPEKIQKHIEKTDVFDAKGAKILVVDDNKINTIIMRGALKPYGIIPDIAMSGMEAISMVKQKDYDIVFMDHMMPVMDGVEALCEIRKLGGKEKQVVVALTANVISGIREQYLQLGFNEFLAKPIEKKELQKILKIFLVDKLK